MQLANSSGINYRQYMNQPTMYYYFKLVFSNSWLFMAMYIACYTAALAEDCDCFIRVIHCSIRASQSEHDQFPETSETSLELPLEPSQDSLLSYVLMCYFDHVTELEHIIMFILHKMIIILGAAHQLVTNLILLSKQVTSEWTSVVK